MAKLRNVMLPSAYVEKLAVVLTLVPDAAVSDAGKRFLPGSIGRPQTVRERIAALLRSEAEIEPWLRELLYAYVPGRRCLDKLSLEGIRSVTPPLLKLLPRSEVVLPLLLDPREEIHKFAEGLIPEHGRDPGPDPANQKCGANELIEFVNSHILAVGRVEASFGSAQEIPTMMKLPNGEVLYRQDFVKFLGQACREMEKSMKASNQLVRNLEEQKRKQRTRLDSVARQASEEKRKLVIERDQALAKARRTEKEKAALEERVREVTAREEAAITAGLQEQTSTLVRKWLTGALETEQHTQRLESRATDLFARVEATLDAQARQDRLTGNRRDLERKLGQLREARQRLAEAATTALRPVPEVKETLAEVEEEIQLTEKILSDRSTTDPLTERLLITINQASDWEAARRCSLCVEQATDLELVPRGDRRRLFDALQRKFSVLEETARPGQSSAGDPGWSLRDAIFRDRPCLILIDGHNALFGMEDIFRGDYDDRGRPGRKACARLVSLAQRLTDGRSHLRIRVLFDAPEHEVITVNPNLAIEFSGGEGEHRADQRIAAHLEFRRPEELKEQWFVVSDDRAVRRQAAVNKVQPVAVDVFAVLLADFGCLHEETIAVSALYAA